VSYQQQEQKMTNKKHLSPAQRRFLDRVERDGYYDVPASGAAAVSAWHRTAKALRNLCLINILGGSRAVLCEPVWFAGGWGCEPIGPVSIATWNSLADSYEKEGSNREQFVQIDSAEELATYNRNYGFEVRS
jgi:hypothetical protein